MPTEPTAGNQPKPDDITTSQVNTSDAKIRELEDRVNSLERLIMRMLDKLELDYPGIGW